ncbi:MAG: DUF262 domain-containing protein [Acidimicrobiaceae bacterium]|nr:DUF262 domain-containing protein [Acidimicrobiaceae bacterium]
MYQPGQTIEEILDDIQRNELVLPAIQREFVWRPDQICRLFDSIMQGYPFGTFLYWSVAPENSVKFRFFDFVRDYHQRDNPHCPALPEMPGRNLTAVLDGQQRLTALNIGLKGSMARKLPNKWWNNPDAFPIKRLYLDLLWKPDDENEEGLRYEFDFLTSHQANNAPENSCWFRVGQVLSMADPGPAMTEWLNERLPQHHVTDAHKVLFRLYEVIRSKHLVAFYTEKSQELDKALQIFIRMNDGGTPLSHSDLLLSIAIAQWKSHDARQEVHDLVDELNRIGTGFTFSKDLVLKAGLMLSNIGAVGFKVDNFNKENMETLEDQWESIKLALILTVRLVASFGLNGQNLTAHNSILPIAYYLHATQPGDAYLMHSQYGDDRDAIRDWLVRSLLKAGVWGSGLDTLLTELRTAIDGHSADGFPVQRIHEALNRRGRTLHFGDEEIEDLVDMRYGDKLTFALLSLLFPFVDMRNQFHVDHIFPSARFSRSRLRKAGVLEDEALELRDLKDRLANLQLLQGALNNEKNAKMPNKWLSSEFDRDGEREYRQSHLLGHVPNSIVDFPDFYDQRRARLRKRITQLLGE